MYREAGALPYGPLARRLGPLWRGLGVVAGVVAMGVGGAVFAFVVSAMLTKEMRGADQLVPGVLPICLGLVVYGADLAWRALHVRSTDHSAFEGRLGRRRAVLGALGGGYVLLYALVVAAVVGTVEPGIDLLLGLLAVLGLSLTISSARGLRRPRSAPVPAFTPELEPSVASAISGTATSARA